MRCTVKLYAFKKKKKNSFNTQKLPSVFSHMPHCKKRFCKWLLVCPRGIVLSRTKSWNLRLLLRLFLKRLQLKTSDIHRKRKSDSHTTNTKKSGRQHIIMMQHNVSPSSEYLSKTRALICFVHSISSVAIILTWKNSVNNLYHVDSTPSDAFYLSNVFLKGGVNHSIKWLQVPQKNKQTRRGEGRDLTSKTTTHLLIDKLILGLLFYCVWNNFIFYPLVFLKNTFL